jgi:hypothetical protein
LIYSLKDLLLTSENNQIEPFYPYIAKAENSKSVLRFSHGGDLFEFTVQDELAKEITTLGLILVDDNHGATDYQDIIKISNLASDLRNRPYTSFAISSNTLSKGKIDTVPKDGPVQSAPYDLVRNGSCTTLLSYLLSVLFNYECESRVSIGERVSTATPSNTNSSAINLIVSHCLHADTFGTLHTLFKASLVDVALPFILDAVHGSHTFFSADSEHYYGDSNELADINLLHRVVSFLSLNKDDPVLGHSVHRFVDEFLISSKTFSLFSSYRNHQSASKDFYLLVEINNTLLKLSETTLNKKMTRSLYDLPFILSGANCFSDGQIQSMVESFKEHLDYKLQSKQEKPLKSFKGINFKAKGSNSSITISNSDTMINALAKLIESPVDCSPLLHHSLLKFEEGTVRCLLLKVLETCTFERCVQFLNKYASVNEDEPFNIFDKIKVTELKSEKLSHQYENIKAYAFKTLSNLDLGDVILNYSKRKMSFKKLVEEYVSNQNKDDVINALPLIYIAQAKLLTISHKIPPLELLSYKPNQRVKLWCLKNIAK